VTFHYLDIDMTKGASHQYTGLFANGSFDMQMKQGTTTNKSIF